MVPVQVVIQDALHPPVPPAPEAALEEADVSIWMEESSGSN